MKELYISPEATIVSFVANQNIASNFDIEIPFEGMQGALLQGVVASESDIELELW